MIQRKFFQFGVLVLFFLMPFCSYAQKGEKIQTIVIDAGHGGKDAGALGRLSTEKSINLSVALKFGAYIEENLPDVKVIYTRTTDKFVELSERAAIANHNKADVFISIHCNSTEGITTADGAETYVMGEVVFKGDSVLAPDRLVKAGKMAVEAKTVRPLVGIIEVCNRLVFLYYGKHRCRAFWWSWVSSII